VYYLLFEKDGMNQWELISGEDAMQIRVGELVEELGCDAEEIIVLPSETEIN